MAPPESVSDEFIVLASYDTRRTAEHVVASLGRKFRTTARKGHASALVVSANPDGSLKLTRSRVLSAGDLTAMVMRIDLAVMIGFHGIYSAMTGTQRTGHATRARRGHVGSDETRAHEILAAAGPNAGLLLLRSSNQQLMDQVSGQVSERAVESWHGTRKQFLDALDPGSQYDWVRTALGQPSS